MTGIRKSLAAGALLATFGSGVGAQEVPDDILRAELRGGWQTDSGSRMAALHLTLAPGWKTYWRAPGDAGFPPSFDWRGSENIGAVSFHWPRPDIFDLNGMRTLGYHDELVLPIELRPERAGAPIRAVARIDLGVCDEICVPVTVEVAADLSGNGAPDPLIRAALDDVPESAATAGLSSTHCAAEPIRDGLRLTTELALPTLGANEFAVVELTGSPVWVSAAETRREGGALIMQTDLVPANAQPFALDRSKVRITVFADGGRAVDVQGCGNG
ncbi:MAG: protein-disulfide reductase DsbD family protein [Paracoccaceae bacterium]